MSTRLDRRVVAKTAAYTVNPDRDRCGTTFTNRGATGSVTFTLPAASSRLTGWWYRFKGAAAQAIVVASAAVDTLTVINDASADSLAIQTSSEIIGGEIEAFCDGTAWFASGVAVGHTYTVAT